MLVGKEAQNPDVRDRDGNPGLPLIWGEVRDKEGKGLAQGDTVFCGCELKPKLLSLPVDPSPRRLWILTLDFRQTCSLQPGRKTSS